MSFAARLPNPLLQGLARFCAALLLECEKYLTKVSPQHIKGSKNCEADALSRNDLKSGEIPSLSSVISAWSQLQTCRICLIPFEFIQIIASISSSPQTEVTYAEIMTKVMALELTILPNGANTETLQSTIC